MISIHRNFHRNFLVIISYCNIFYFLVGCCRFLAGFKMHSSIMTKNLALALIIKLSAAHYHSNSNKKTNTKVK